MRKERIRSNEGHTIEAASSIEITITIIIDYYQYTNLPSILCL